MKMNSVEMDKRVERMPSSVKNAMTAVAASMAMVAFIGVPVLWCTLASQGGTMWARAMWVRYRACPTAATSKTVVIPLSAPNATKYFAQSIPTEEKATENGASGSTF